MEMDANTFPFHNLLPYSESNEGLFLFFSPSLNWIKEKSVATLAIRNICDQKKNKFQSQFSHRITNIIAKKRTIANEPIILTETCSAILQGLKIPVKEKDRGAVTIPCTIGDRS